jgi:hypothetical protein
LPGNYLPALLLSLSRAVGAYFEKLSPESIADVGEREVSMYLIEVSFRIVQAGQNPSLCHEEKIVILRSSFSFFKVDYGGIL